MKKSKLIGDIAVMEVSHHSTIRSRTRAAKALALQGLSKTKTTATEPPQTDVSSFSYLQLRSRRLEKLPSLVSNRTKQKKNDRKRSEGCFEDREIVIEVGFCCGTDETSFGEHRMDFELKDRSTRESTPCSLILKDYETVAAAAPGSTTRPRSSPSTHERGPVNDVQRFIPSTQEIEEFFACAEQQQQHRQFLEKYNFDIVNDLPLPGRYEWLKVNPIS